MQFLDFVPCNPTDWSNQPVGLMMPNTKIVGVSKRKIAAASVHFGPRTTRTMSSANKAQKMVDRHGHRDDKRVAFQEVTSQTDGVVLEP